MACATDEGGSRMLQASSSSAKAHAIEVLSKHMGASMGKQVRTPIEVCLRPSVTQH